MWQQANIALAATVKSWRSASTHRGLRVAVDKTLRGIASRSNGYNVLHRVSRGCTLVLTVSMHPKNACTMSGFCNDKNHFSIPLSSKMRNGTPTASIAPGCPSTPNDASSNIGNKVESTPSASGLGADLSVDAVSNVGGSSCITSMFARDNHTAVSCL